MSLEDELTLDSHVPAQDQYAAPVDRGADAAATGDHAVADEDFAGHFDDAMADVDMDFAGSQRISSRHGGFRRWPLKSRTGRADLAM